MLMTEDKRLDEIIRVKRVAGNFATMNKGFLEDARLSFKAKGILSYLLSKPDDWKVIVRDIVEHGKDGKSAVYAGLKELREAGYYEKKPIRNEEGSRIVRWESTVYEVPRQLFDDEPKGAFEPEQEEPKEVEEVRPAEQEVKSKKSVKNQSQKPNFLISKFSKQEKQSLENEERNKNNFTKNYSTGELNHSLSQTGADKTALDKTVTEKMSTFFKRQIHYNDLVEGTYESDSKLINEFVHVALDCLLSEGNTVRINNENKPRELVKGRLMKLTYAHFTYILERFKAQTHKIKKKRQYMLSMLYNATMELECHYHNAVATDWGY